MRKYKNKYVLTFVFLLIILISIIIILNNRATTQITQLSMNGGRQMMGYIIKTANGKIIVIDGGTKEDSDNLMKYLENENYKVDSWFLTHAHDDHAGAFVKIVNDNNIKIDNIYVSLNEKEWYEKNEPDRATFSEELIDVLNNNNIKEKVREPKLNEIIKIDNLKIEILGIKNPEILENCGNEQSMVLKISTKHKSFMILGDIGIQSSEKLLETQKNKLKSDIVQMAHHGQNGATEELYNAINPEICFWPTPEWLWNNDNGGGYNSGIWKTLETRAWMEKMNVKENFVEKDGDISISIK